MTRLYVIRHGETEWSRSGQHTSVTDLPLTARGEEQARALHGHLDPAEFQLILSSPRRRALHTAELAGFTGQYEPNVTEDLAEWFYGNYEGRTSADINEGDPDWTIWTHPTPGGETSNEVRARMDRVIQQIHDSGAEQAVCFAHGHSLRALTVRWLQLDMTLGARFPLDTGTVSVLGEVKGVPALERWNAGF